MSALSFLILAGVLSLATGCRDGERSASAAPAPHVTPLQTVPNDSGIFTDGTLAPDALTLKGPAK